MTNAPADHTDYNVRVMCRDGQFFDMPPELRVHTGNRGWVRAMDLTCEDQIGCRACRKVFDLNGAIDGFCLSCTDWHKLWCGPFVWADGSEHPCMLDGSLHGGRGT